MKIVVFAGPNGSGKSTIVKDYLESNNCRFFISPDNISAEHEECKSIEDEFERNKKAADIAESIRKSLVSNFEPFAFETVLSTISKLDFLKDAIEKGYEIHSIYVVTQDPLINIERVRTRVSQGGHDVPQEKIVSRHGKSIQLMPRVIEISKSSMVYDNSEHMKLVYQKVNDFHGLMNIDVCTEQDKIFIEEVLIKPLMAQGYITNNLMEFSSDEYESFKVYAALSEIYKDTLLDPLKLSYKNAVSLLNITLERNKALTLKEIEELIM